MTHKEWQELRVRFCEHAGTEVSLQAEVAYPAENLPDLAPRVLHHRCSHGYACAIDSKGVCVWSGANPDYDPFQVDQ